MNKYFPDEEKDLKFEYDNKILKKSLLYSDYEILNTLICDIYGKFKFLMIEINSEIGINTISFMNNSKISTILSYESNSEYLKYLKHNISNYKKKLSSKVLFIDNITEIFENKNSYGSCVYFSNLQNYKNYINDFKDLIYVFILKSDDILQNINFDIKKYDNFIIGINKNFVKSLGIKNKFGLEFVKSKIQSPIINENDDEKYEDKTENVIIDQDADELTGVIYIDKKIKKDELFINKLETPSKPVKIPSINSIKSPKRTLKKNIVKSPPSSPPSSPIKSPSPPSSPPKSPSPPSSPIKEKVEIFELKKRNEKKINVDPIISPIISNEEDDDENDIIKKLKKNGVQITDTKDLQNSIEIVLSNDLEVFLNSLPNSKTNYLNNPIEYDKEFLIYLKKLLSKFISNETVLDYITSNNNFIVWKKAFTHITYNYDDNYEELEFIGDATLKHSYTSFLFKKYPKITTRAASEFNSQFLSTTSLCQYGIKMKLNQWLISRELNMTSLNVKIFEDLFEAFLGALIVTTDSFKKGLSSIYAYNFIDILFSDLNYNPKMIYGTSKTSLIQRGGGLGLKDDCFQEIEQKFENPYRINIKIKINSFYIKTFLECGFNIDTKNLIIGEGSANTKKTAANIAYTNAIIFMEKKYNFTYVECQLKGYLIKLNKFNQELVAKCKTKALTEKGYDILELDRPASSYGSKVYTVILYGFKKSDPDNLIEKRNKEILAVYTYNTDLSTLGDTKSKIIAEENTLKKYLAS